MAPSQLKRGLAWPWNNPKTHFPLYQAAIDSGKISWLMNWELWKPEGCLEQLEYVPMVRTAKEVENIDSFLASLWPDQRKAGEHRHFLGLNEPDIASQANLSVKDALEIWNKHVVPARSKFKFRLGAPAVSSAPEGRVWLRQFFDQLEGDGMAKLAFLPVHWYGTNAAEFKQYLRSMHDEFRRPLWVTEFACVRMDGQSASSVEIEAFLTESMALLDGLDFVERYAWFGAMDEPGEWTGKEIALTETSGGKSKLRSVGKMYCEL